MVELLDCTLRDGSNVVGAGFSKGTTVAIIESLIDSGIKAIEMGHSSGLGGNEAGVKMAPLSDEEYIETAAPYFSKAEIGMFCQPKWATKSGIKFAAQKGLGFLRVGINAGDSSKATDLIKEIRDYGIKVRTSLMKAYILPPERLAEEAHVFESAGANAVTIMDSAGYMLPEDVIKYVSALKNAVSIPVGFHGHNNLGLSVANGLAAWHAGAASIDCGVMGMARSVGNIPTEVFIGVLWRLGEGVEYDLHTLLSRIDNAIMPLLKPYYHNPIPPVELILGIAGCHSNYLPMFREAAKKHGADLYKLILKVSAQDKKTPSMELIESFAAKARR
ncbi:MAG TPA: 4-hydroxy-2-oxovalerate aldolase [Synergistaceae bacterium]|nr:4-hydroxy-2-oxovalerate aldolase [Synergistaceae bacterium]